MRILSGIQPSGILHIGNYFGMMRPAIALQDEGEAFYFIADYHSLTALQIRRRCGKTAGSVALDFLACGLDPERAVFFRQSDVPEVTELAWILSTVTPMGLLELRHLQRQDRARHFGVRRALHLSGADGGGHFDLRHDIVPVGKDQKQHVEMTRDIAMKFNETFGDGRASSCRSRAFSAATEVVPGLDGQKMSKSYGNTIEIFGDEKEMRKRVMSIVTDSTPVEAPKDPDNSTIVQTLFVIREQVTKPRACAEQFKKGRRRLRRLQETTIR